MTRVLSSGARIFALLLGLALAPGVATAQDGPYPDRPVLLYVGYAPGGFSAVSAQIIAEKLRQHLKQPVVINYKPGANQGIAAEFVKNSKPDGYTLIFFAQGEVAAKLAKEKAEGAVSAFQLADFDSLAGGPYSPNAVAVPLASAWTTMEQFVDAARKAPGKLSFGSTGVGATGHLQMDVLAQRAGVVLNHVPFPGGSQAVTAVAGGHVDITTFSASTLGSQIKAGGKLRPLLVLDANRTELAPGVPTSVEKGYDLIASSWQAVSAPRGLPDATRKVLVDALANTMKDLEVIEKLRKLDSAIQYLSPADVDRKTRAEYELYLQAWDRVNKK